MAEEQLGPHAPTSTVYKNGYRFNGIERDNRLTDRNTVTIIYRSYVFQSISEPATPLSLSLSLSLELLGDACEGICMQWLVLYAREDFLSALVQSIPTICLFLLLIYNIHVVVLPVHQLLELELVHCLCCI